MCKRTRYFTIHNCLVNMDETHKPVIYLRFYHSNYQIRLSLPTLSTTNIHAGWPYLPAVSAELADAMQWPMADSLTTISERDSDSRGVSFMTHPIKHLPPVLFYGCER